MKTTTKTILIVLGACIIGSLLWYHFRTSPATSHFSDLQNNLEQLINQEKSSGKATSISVYFDTLDGNTIAINQDESYTIDQTSLSKTYSEIGIPASDIHDHMTVVDYSKIVTGLYNATDLNRDMSDTALETMSKSNFPGGIEAGLPTGMKVAEQFDQTTKELHDCGVIYYPNHPYLLCIMTKGSAIPTLTSVVKDISNTVYLFADGEFH